MNLRRLLIKNNTLVVVGGLLVLMVGIGGWLSLKLERESSIKYQRIQAIAERLLHEQNYPASFELRRPKVTPLGDDKYQVKGLLRGRTNVIVEIEKKGGEWSIIHTSYILIKHPLDEDD